MGLGAETKNKKTALRVYIIPEYHGFLGPKLGINQGPPEEVALGLQGLIVL